MIERPPIPDGSGRHWAIEHGDDTTYIQGLLAADEAAAVKYWRDITGIYFLSAVARRTTLYEDDLLFNSAERAQRGRTEERQ